MGSMAEQSSGEVWVLGKIAELVERFGISPVDWEVSLTFVDTEEGPPPGESYYYLHGFGVETGTPEYEAKITKLYELLGLDELGRRKVDWLGPLADDVEKALALAPRARVR